ncbi:MAG: hypothetical protein HY727_00265 [Candidatus Rokubacteria bacterium]|nr:hypothetical protein [Candidatus Rokubacteria bacterium]
MTRWALATLGVLLVLGAAAVGVARRLGWSESRASVFVSVLAHWLGAYALWSLAAGAALRYGVLEVYDGGLFALLALGGGAYQYRAQVREGRARGLVVFVGAQLAWLLIVLARNGVFGAS